MSDPICQQRDIIPKQLKLVEKMSLKCIKRLILLFYTIIKEIDLFAFVLKLMI